MTAAGAPDVTVVVAVYNTMPYLTECLTSLVGQSIGLDRLEVVAVDDGSTDGSGEELDRFAERYPDTVKVIHQENSGGPAAPSNRALEVATGRYVYFIGADDHLGEEALARMVAYADEHGSDVLAGKMVGTGGRYVDQKLYRENTPDISLYDSRLPFALANTKLFRRELVERHKLRFPEDMPVGSDQPFTIEACVRAARISVLADYTCYYAVKRGDAGNITYRADHLARLHCVERIMHRTAELIEPGPRRDAVLRRHFTWELAKLVQGDFPSLGADLQRRLCAGIAALADAYFTPAVQDAMDVKRRMRIALARAGAREELIEAISSEAANGAPPFHLEGDRAFARYPGFRDARFGLPDRVFELVGEVVPGRLAARTELLGSAWEVTDGRLWLNLDVRLGVTGDAERASIGLARGAMPKSADKPGARVLPAAAEPPSVEGEFTLREAPDGSGSVLGARVPVAATTSNRGVRVYLPLGGRMYEIPVRGKGLPMPLAVRWGTDAPHRASASVNKKGRMVVITAPLNTRPPTFGARLRSLPAKLKRK